MAKVILATAAVIAMVTLGACSSSSSKTPATGASGTTSPSGASAPSGAGGGTLHVTGSVSVSLNQTNNSITHCKAPTTGTTTSGGLEGNTSGTLSFTDGTTYYALQFSVGSGTTAFPGGAVHNFVGFYPSNDSTKEWSIGTQVSKSENGTVTFSANKGTIDAELAPDPPEPNPSLQPIHVKGTFVCS